MMPNDQPILRYRGRRFTTRCTGGVLAPLELQICARLLGDFVKEPATYMTAEELSNDPAARATVARFIHVARGIQVFLARSTRPVGWFDRLTAPFRDNPFAQADAHELRAVLEFFLRPPPAATDGTLETGGTEIGAGQVIPRRLRLDVRVCVVLRKDR